LGNAADAHVKGRNFAPLRIRADASRRNSHNAIAAKPALVRCCVLAGHRWAARGAEIQI